MLTDEVPSYRPAAFWRTLDACDAAGHYIGGDAFGTVSGVWAVEVRAGAFVRWAWECPKCGRCCGVLYRVSIARPLCRVCAGLGYPSQFEKASCGLLGLSRGERYAEQRRAARRARWRRYYARHSGRILARRHELAALKADTCADVCHKTSGNRGG